MARPASARPGTRPGGSRDTRPNTGRGPGALSYGSAGIGSAGHLSGALLDHLAKTEAVHVPYRGGGQLITDLISGKIDYSFATAATVLPHIDSGRLRVLAVPTEQRSRLQPTGPNLAEA